LSGDKGLLTILSRFFPRNPQYLFDFGFDLWDVTLDDIPNDLEIHIIIAGYDAITHTGHSFPGDIWIALAAAPQASVWPLRQ
jgi:hypothetical protein